ncbi:MAG: hypothetical protein K6C34_05805 [Alphaproteobacteria bacterium]|nr:hypothetical protein [Alphaproteobacteria bacterium]
MGCDKKNSLITEDEFYILDTLEQNGYAARIVGGAVRNFLLNKTYEDIDIATTATTQQTTDVFRKIGLPVIPLGAKYGTSLIRYHGKSYEISALRRDVKTFGRQAEVEFTDSYEVDSSRRDFTINALYMDKYGEIFDYHSGLRDIKNHNIRFIGDARTRIVEDFLRIFRYFRFVVQYGEYQFSEEYLNIIADLKSCIHQLSFERIYKELVQMFSVDDSYKIVPNMFVILRELFGLEVDSLLVCFQLGIFEELSAEERLCMLLKFSDVRVVTHCKLPSHVKQMATLPFSDITNAKHCLRRTKENLREFYIKYLTVKWFVDGVLSKSQAREMMHILMKYCEDGYATFPLKSEHLKDFSLSAEQLKQVMIAARNFWKTHDNVNLADCIQFTKRYISEGF